MSFQLCLLDAMLATAVTASCRDSDDMGMAQDLFQSECWAAPSPRQCREYMDLETNKEMHRRVQCKSGYIPHFPSDSFVMFCF